MPKNTRTTKSSGGTESVVVARAKSKLGKSEREFIRT